MTIIQFIIKVLAAIGLVVVCLFIVAMAGVALTWWADHVCERDVAREWKQEQALREREKEGKGE